MCKPRIAPTHSPSSTSPQSMALSVSYRVALRLNEMKRTARPETRRPPPTRAARAHALAAIDVHTRVLHTIRVAYAHVHLLPLYLGIVSFTSVRRRNVHVYDMRYENALGNNAPPVAGIHSHEERERELHLYNVRKTSLPIKKKFNPHSNGKSTWNTEHEWHSRKT